MYAQKAFLYQRTRRGGTVKKACEKYLRDDIPCGIHGCSICSEFSESSSSSMPLLSSKEDGTGMLCIVDYRVVLEQLAFIEAPAVVNLVFTQTVVNFIKQQNMNIYRRLEICLDMKEKHFYQFFNEFHAQVSSAKPAFVDGSVFAGSSLLLLQFFLIL